MSNRSKIGLVIILVALCFYEIYFIVGKLNEVSLETRKEILQSMEKQEKVLQEINKNLEALPSNTAKEVKKEVAPYDDLGYRKSYELTRPLADIRKDDFGVSNKHKIKIYTHKSGKEPANPHDMHATIKAVCMTLPNIKTTPEFVDLIFEMYIAETYLGKASFEDAVKRYKNYGFGQFRLGTAKEVLNWLKVTRKDVYEAVMKYNNPKHDLAWNILHNVPFHIALSAETVWRMVPDIYANIGTLEKRAEFWKASWNTYKGLGTVNKYIQRVQSFKKRYMEEKTSKLTKKQVATR